MSQVCKQDAKTLAVPQAIESLTHRLGILAERVTAIGLRLSPILGPPNPPPTETDHPEPLAGQLRGEIDTQRDHVDRLIAQLGDYIERLEL